MGRRFDHIDLDSRGGVVAGVVLSSGMQQGKQRWEGLSVVFSGSERSVRCPSSRKRDTAAVDSVETTWPIIISYK